METIGIIGERYRGEHIGIMETTMETAYYNRGYIGETTIF